MTSRVDGSTFAQEWNEDNRLTKVTVNGLVTQFFYDADGALIKEFGSDQKITVTVGSHYEWDNATNAGKTRSFYFFNGQRIAVRERDVATPNNDAITFYHPDHLGSINAVTGSGGSTLAQMRYKPFGEKRWTNNESALGSKRFNGNTFEEGLKLYYYGARWYYPTVGRFLSADTIVPNTNDPQQFNRYTYARSNPLGFIDPTGHQTVGPQVPAWKPEYIDDLDTETRFKATAAYRHFLADPNYFVKLYTDPTAWTNNEEVTSLRLYSMYSELGTMPEALVRNFVVNAYGFDTLDAVDGALMHNFTANVEDKQNFEVDDISGIVGIAATVHGNGRGSTKKTWLYRLAKKTGEFLKWGVTSRNAPEQRYSKDFMKDKKMNVVDQGSRAEMLERERALTVSNPGPLNKEPWAGSDKK